MPLKISLIFKIYFVTIEKMIIIIDNYDSFTYNLVQQIGAFGERMEVFRNDKVSIEEIEGKMPDHIIISPGPCTPKEAGISNAIIKNFSGKIPILLWRHGIILLLSKKTHCPISLRLPPGQTMMRSWASDIRNIHWKESSSTRNLS